jgi:hypothetical protein
VSLIDGTGATALPELQAPSQVDPPPQLSQHRRVSMDVNAEAHDVQIRYEWKGAGTPPPLETPRSTTRYSSSRPPSAAGNGFGCTTHVRVSCGLTSMPDYDFAQHALLGLLL